MGYAIAQLARAASLISAVSVITSFLARVSGFNLVDAYFGSELTASPEQRATLASKWGLDQSTIIQFGLWWWNLLYGDLGTSLVFERFVTAVIGDALVSSSMLLFIAWLASGLLETGLGIVAGKNQGRFLNRVINTVCCIFAAIPTLWLGIVLLLILAVRLKRFPIGLSAPADKTLAEATLVEYLDRLALSVAILSLVGISAIMTQTRTRLVEERNSDYALFARSRGEAPWQFVQWHGPRNSLISSATLQFGPISKIIGGSVLAESILSYAGPGTIMIMAGAKRDLPPLIGITVISFAIVFLGNLYANLLYPLIDPRVKETWPRWPC